jgi:hypothetical protein
MRAEWEIEPPSPSSCTICRERNGFVLFSTLVTIPLSFRLRVVAVAVVVPVAVMAAVLRLRSACLSGASSTGDPPYLDESGDVRDEEAEDENTEAASAVSFVVPPELIELFREVTRETGLTRDELCRRELLFAVLWHGPRCSDIGLLLLKLFGGEMSRLWRQDGSAVRI